MSGPIGATISAGVGAVRVWVRHVNAKGGLNGHEIQYVVFDDGGDPARHKAQVKEAIERRKVIAFVFNAEGITGASSVGYITSKRVPVIGSEGSGPWFYQSPMYFPPQPHADQFYFSAIYGTGSVFAPAGKTKLGTVACSELQRCAEFEQAAAKAAPKVGLQYVYKVRASVAQPDYSAECLSARNAEAQVIFVALDSNSVARLALSCARQGYRPTFATMASIATDRFKDDANLDGIYVATNVFPYFQSGTPATDEYHQAFAAHSPKSEPGVGVATGWVAAKLFEKVAANMPEPPTSEAVLRGLWSLRGDTLGGIAMPLTFLENQLAPTAPVCWFNIAVQDRTWKSIDGYKMHCRQD